MIMKKIRFNIRKLLMSRRNNYIYPDDIRTVGKTVYLLKKAYKDPKPHVIILVPNKSQGILLKKYATQLGLQNDNVTFFSIQDFVFIMQVTTEKILQSSLYIEEGIKQEQLEKVNKYIPFPILKNLVKLSYSDYRPKELKNDAK